MNDSRGFKDAESVCSGPLSTLSVNWPYFLFLLSQDDCWAALKIRSMIFGMRTVCRETFLRIRMLNSSAPCSKTLNLWHDPAAERIPAQESTGTPLAGVSDRDTDTIPTPRFSRSSSAENSFYLMDGRKCRNYAADQQRLQISELHFGRFRTPQTFSRWNMRFKTEVCSCSNFATEAMLRTKEVELANSVDDLKSSCSIQGIATFPDFELLDASIASALNKIIQNSYFKKMVSLQELTAQKHDRFPRGRQIARLICDYFRVTGVNDSVLDYADSFTVVLRKDNIQEFDTR